MIRYDAIGAMSVTRMASQRFVCIEASDLDAVIASTADPRERRRLLRSVAWTGSPWALPNTTTVTADDLLSLLVRYVTNIIRSHGSPRHKRN